MFLTCSRGRCDSIVLSMSGNEDFRRPSAMSEMIWKFCCQECGERAATAALVQVVGIRRPVLVRTMLLGKDDG